MIRIICLGKLKEEYLKNGINDYLKRINKYHKCEIIELKDDVDILKEEQQMIKYVDNHDYNVCLDILGKEVSSIDLANLIDTNLMNYGNINFFIGSSNGLSQKLKDMCNSSISFGRVTLPHGVFRLVLSEQIYRGFKINNNEKYHK